MVINDIMVIKIFDLFFVVCYNGGFGCGIILIIFCVLI